MNGAKRLPPRRGFCERINTNSKNKFIFNGGYKMKRSRFLLHGAKQLSMGAIFSGMGFLLYTIATITGQEWAAEAIVMIFSVVSVYVFASVAAERRRDKRAVSLNLYWGQAALSLLTCMCAILMLREKTGL